MESHVNVICHSAIFHLRNITKIRRYLNPSATEQIVHAFVTSRLDMGNALLYGLPKKQFRSLQKIQNWAARLVKCAKRFEHVTPMLKDLHWLPVESRVQFKILLLVYRCLNGCAPEYISILLNCKESRRELRSSQQVLLDIPRSKHRWGDQAFSTAAPRLWNKLPLKIRQSPSLDSFKSQLKMHLF